MAIQIPVGCGMAEQWLSTPRLRRACDAYVEQGFRYGHSRCFCLCSGSRCVRATANDFGGGAGLRGLVQPVTHAAQIRKPWEYRYATTFVTLMTSRKIRVDIPRNRGYAGSSSCEGGYCAQTQVPRPRTSTTKAPGFFLTSLATRTICLWPTPGLSLDRRRIGAHVALCRCRSHIS